MYKLFLDDERAAPNDDWVVARNYLAFCQIIDDIGMPNLISFDHDLGADVPSGYDAAKYLVMFCDRNNLQLPDYQVHSANPCGADNIRSYLESYRKSLTL